MTVTKIIQGLLIIQKAKPDKESDYFLRAEYDVIYAGSLDWIIPEDDKLILDELGWFADEHADGWGAYV